MSPTGRPLRILALGHEATHTGAPLLLLHLLKEWQRSADVEISVVFRRPGPLIDEFRPWGVRTLSPAALEGAWRPLSMAKHTLRNRHPAPMSGILGSTRSGISRTRLRQRALWDRASLSARRVRDRLAPDAVFANTATHGDLIPYFEGTPIVSYVHERALLLDEIALPGTVVTQLNMSTRVVAVADIVRDDLVTSFSIDPARVDVVRPFALPTSPPLPGDCDARRKVVAEYGLSPDTFLVGAVGALSWVKDPEAFVRVAARVRALRPEAPIAFLWLGAAANAQQLARYEALPGAFGVSSSVHFIGPSPNPGWFYEAIDVLAVTSQTDSFPLVVLEAARAGKPCICFEASGGALEFVRSDAGVVVPGRDTDAMAAALVELAHDPARRSALGAVARERVTRDHRAQTVAGTLLSITREAAGWPSSQP